MKSSSLIERLQKLYPDSSKNTLKLWIKQGRVLEEENGNVKLLPKPRFTETGGIKILYRDRYLVVLEKPEGVLSVKAAFESQETLHKYVKETFGAKNAKVVHRLDQGTSGVIMFALEEKAYEKLKKMFEKHEVDRRYKALVEGRLHPKKGTWKSYLWEDKAYKVHSSQDPDSGREAITHYKVLHETKNFSLVEFKLETGRKNQIRVHAAENGHPIAGDTKYGSKKNPIKRLALHAFSLEFTHPILDKKIKVKSPLPSSFDKFAS
ncbi:MAG: RluA family pseudouridine synthase [Chlamydiia bacterium]|nr:RluA family pseudouridine synthase [Chlamydiia bacterium]